MALSKSKTVERAMISGRISRTQTVSPEELYNMIAEAAYYRAEQRGFQGGDPLADWLAAEKKINEMLTKEG